MTTRFRLRMTRNNTKIHIQVDLPHQKKGDYPAHFHPHIESFHDI